MGGKIGYNFGFPGTMYEAGKSRIMNFYSLLLVIMLIKCFGGKDGARETVFGFSSYEQTKKKGATFIFPTPSDHEVLTLKKEGTLRTFCPNFLHLKLAALTIKSVNVLWFYIY